MNRIKLMLKKTIFITLVIITFLTINFQSVSSQFFLSESRDFDQIGIHFVPPPPPEQGAPSGRRRGGASRGLCKKYEAITALVPMNNGFVWGLTTVEHPVFLFFVPQAVSNELPVEFVLQDSSDNYLYKTTFILSQIQKGVIKISLPATTKPLEIDQSYQWTFSIYCDPNKTSTYVYVQGLVQRVVLEAGLESQLETATPLEQVAIYANRGIWYDALATLAKLRRISPDDSQLATAWMNLLEQVELEAIASEPVIDCCDREKNY